MKNIEEFRKEQALSNQFLAKVAPKQLNYLILTLIQFNSIKTKSKTLKKRTSKNEISHLWNRSYNSLKIQQSNLEIDLESIYTSLEHDPEYAFLSGKTGTPIQDEIQARTNNRIVLDDKLYQEIRRMKSVNEEMSRGVRRSEDQYLGLVDEIFGFFEQTHENCNLDLLCFKQENKFLDKLTAFYRKNDTVRGFDLADGIEVELDLDYGDLEDFVGDEEQNMIDLYEQKIEKLALKTKLELEALSSKDVTPPPLTPIN